VRHGREREQGRRGDAQEPAGLGREGRGELLLARLRRESEHARDEREAVGGGTELTRSGQGCAGTEATADRVVRTGSSAVPAEPLHCSLVRRGGRVAEGTRLLSEYGEAISIAGSNPALSAGGG
jgi:hypothetical protein